MYPYGTHSVLDTAPGFECVSSSLKATCRNETVTVYNNPFGPACFNVCDFYHGNIRGIRKTR